MYKYNFFREIADQLPYGKPVSTETQAVREENSRLGEQIRQLESGKKMLEMEVKILRQTLKDLAGK